MWMAKAKHAITIATQVTFAALDLAVEMCTRPWIVELSRNSLTAVVVIFRFKKSFFETRTGRGLQPKYGLTTKDPVPLLYTDDALCIFNSPKKVINIFSEKRVMERPFEYFHSKA